MTVAQLIEYLKKYDANAEVMILDGFNGGGSPRTLNCGPHERRILDKDAEEIADCEGRAGEVVVVLGYGSY